MGTLESILKSLNIRAPLTVATTALAVRRYVFYPLFVLLLVPREEEEWWCGCGRVWRCWWAGAGRPSWPLAGGTSHPSGSRNIHIILLNRILKEIETIRISLYKKMVLAPTPSPAVLTDMYLLTLS
jgi:hypothetical protein